MPSVSGPKRPHDRIDLDKLHEDFTSGLTAKVSFKVTIFYDCKMGNLLFCSWCCVRELVLNSGIKPSS